MLSLMPLELFIFFYDRFLPPFEIRLEKYRMYQLDLFLIFC